MSLNLHRAPDTGLLADGLADLLRNPPGDPFAEEVVVVPAKGVERWLTQRLSHRLGATASTSAATRREDGICAGVRFLNPHSLVELLTDTGADDPWRPDRLAWPVLEVLDESVDEAWCAPLARHLGALATGVEAELRRNRRWALARRLAGLLGSYAVQRPQVLTDWREGRATDGAGAALPDDLAWQPELWRRVLGKVAADPPDVRHAEAVATLRRGEGPLADRLSLFGHTRIPVTEAELLGALATHHEVHLWLPLPSPGLWRDLAEPVSAGPVRRRLDTSAEAVRHPLLASLGRDTRELQRTLSLLESPVPGGAGADPTPAEVETAAAATLLARLQADVRANRAPTGHPGSAPDDSVQVHACHGAPRQVEVLREVLVGLLQDDPTLQPRDVLVMCPDVDTYAPLIQAAFGLGPVPGAHPAHGLNVRLADRGLLHTNPLLSTAAAVLEIAGGRATASDVLDLAASPAVRQRFGFTDDDVRQLQAWVHQSAVRWGLDAPSRARFGMEEFSENTWSRGLDRLLLGVATPEEGYRVVGRALPLDDVASGEIDLAGRFTELVTRLTRACEVLSAPAPAQEWITALREAVESVADVAWREAWQRSQFERELAALTCEATSSEIGLADARTMLAHRLAGRPTRANFRTGALTVATMVPMRSVPHRVVCLLGLDDGVFPRSLTLDGDDVLARDPFTGERDGRSEDRQLLLDAILAAREKLVITYSGASAHTGEPRPPSVPLGELLDALDRMTDASTQHPVHHSHRLQPFAESEFDGFSFDTAARRGAEALRQQVPPTPFLSTPLPPVEPDLTLVELVAFFRNPARALLNRLEVSTPRDGEQVKDAMPIDLDGLETWTIGDRMIRAVLAGDDPQDICTAELFRGELPPGRLGEGALRKIVETAQHLVSATSRVHTPEPEALQVDLELTAADGGHARLVGTVPGLHSGAHLLRLTYSKVAAKHLLPAWLELLAVSAAFPERGFKAHVLGRGARRDVSHVMLGPVGAEAATELLTRLVGYRAEGLRRPWLVPLATGHAWAAASRTGAQQEYSKAAGAWDSSAYARFPGEADDPAFVRLLGPRSRLGALGPEFGGRADALWYPLLDHLQEVQ